MERLYILNLTHTGMTVNERICQTSDLSTARIYGKIYLENHVGKDYQHGIFSAFLYGP